MNYILFDGTVRNALLPFTFTRPVADIRIGILTIREKWEKHLGSTTTTVTEEYLSEKYPMVEMEENVMINASFLPNNILVEMVKNLEMSNIALMKETPLIQIIDKPIYPIDVERFGKLKGIIMGLLTASLITILIILVKRIYNEIINNEN